MVIETRQLIQAIHDSPGRTVIVAAGAGTQALAWLLGVAGASRTLLEALIPYDEASFNDFLGQRPRKYVAARTAGMLAGRAVTRAKQLHPAGEPVIGLACTATIVTDRPTRGQHRAHISIWTREKADHHLLQLSKGARDRDGEEGLVSRLMLNVLAEAYQVPFAINLPLVDGDLYSRSNYDLKEAAEDLLNEKFNFFGIRADGRPHSRRITPKVLLSGSFDPLHDGHLALAKVAAEMLGHQVTFELAAMNADKPTLKKSEILSRILQFAGRHPVLASNAPRYISKAQLYPGTTFVIGYDTAERVLHPRFYENSQDEMEAALEEIRRHGCRFLVAGRADQNGVYHDAGQLSIPSNFRELFQAIPAEKFRNDISSTELRISGQPGSR